MQQVVPPPGEARPDWQWVQQVAHEMSFDHGMSFTSAAEIFDEFVRTTANRPNDQSGLSHKTLREQGPQHWPHAVNNVPTQRRYTHGVFPTPTGKARFWDRAHLPREEILDEKFPFVLTTGRTLNQWHTRTKTGLVEQLNQKDPAPSLQMNPGDAATLGLLDGQPARITSRRGEARSTLRIDPDISPGCVFLPIHWNDLWAAGSSPNEVTSNHRDAISKQPVLKHCAVAVIAVERTSDERQPPRIGAAIKEVTGDGACFPSKSVIQSDL
jgi:anaerobic selenocysteine-containing dehydrogenase